MYAKEVLQLGQTREIKALLTKMKSYIDFMASRQNTFDANYKNALRKQIKVARVASRRTKKLNFDSFCVTAVNRDVKCFAKVCPRLSAHTIRCCLKFG